MSTTHRFACLIAAAALCAPVAAQDPADVVIEATRVAPNVYMITGMGGNIPYRYGIYPVFRKEICCSLNKRFFHLFTAMWFFLFHMHT